MTRLAILILIPTLTLAACAGPIVTRVETNAPAALPAVKSFSFNEKPDQDNDLYQEAQILVAKALEAKGFLPSDKATLLVQIALADRPANIGIDVGEDGETVSRSAKKQRRFLQSCEDREHRLIVSLVNKVTGNIVYSGMASEYHCKGTLKESLPYLIDAAITDLGSAPNPNTKKTTKARTGLE